MDSQKGSRCIAARQKKRRTLGVELGHTAITGMLPPHALLPLELNDRPARPRA